ncbi:MAG: ABC transporter ATP-binding protein [Alphaproteobacteria bacterium]
MTLDRSAGGGPEFAIAAHGLKKTYRGPKPVAALKGIDLEIPRGSIFGLLGPNGAGKSTFINILAGLVIKTEGKLAIWDIDVDQDPRGARAAIGVVPQELIIDPFFTPREALAIHAGYYGVPRDERRTDEILDAVGLSAQAEINARRLSGGMRRRLLIAKALVHSPPVVVLDEPTAGVDVELREQLWNHMRRLNAQGVTILLTTHYIDEAEQLCEWIAIIDHGRLIVCERTRALVERLDHKELVILLEQELDGIPPALGRFPVELAGPKRLVVRYRRRETRIDEILGAVRAAGLSVADLSTKESDLEDIFRELTKGSHAPAGEAPPGEAPPGEAPPGEAPPGEA